MPSYQHRQVDILLQTHTRMCSLGAGALHTTEPPDHLVDTQNGRQTHRTTGAGHRETWQRTLSPWQQPAQQQGPWSWWLGLSALLTVKHGAGTCALSLRSCLEHGAPTEFRGISGKMEGGALTPWTPSTLNQQGAGEVARSGACALHRHAGSHAPQRSRNSHKEHAAGTRGAQGHTLWRAATPRTRDAPTGTQSTDLPRWLRVPETRGSRYCVPPRDTGAFPKCLGHGRNPPAQETRPSNVQSTEARSLLRLGSSPR